MRMHSSTNDVVKALLDGSQTCLFNFIDGQFSGTDEQLESVNPATGAAFLRLPRSSLSHVNAAVAAAKQAFPVWSSSSVQSRARLLQRTADIIESLLDELAVLESRDQGKPVWLARVVDIPRCVQNLRFFASAALHHTEPSAVLAEPSRALSYVVRDPVGVAAAISPWNLPVYLLSFKLAPALAAGCTVVCKPSELTSATAYVLMHAFREAGLPAGVVNMVIGTGGECGEPLVTHPDVALVSFTGSTLIGRRIAGLCAPSNKKTSLEMGGKNAGIICKSVDIPEIVPDVVRSCFINQGEICLCTSRLFVHSDIFDDFVRDFVEEAKKYTVGDPEVASSKLGAINSKAHFAKVMSYIALAVEEGGTILFGGKAVSPPGRCSGGWFIEPTAVTGLRDDCRCMTEEIFGPVVCIQKFTGTQEVIERANASPYGLSATVFSRESAELHSIAHALRVGTVWCNTWMVRDLNMPFGGTKQSGLGREGGADSLHFFTEQKTVCIKY